MHRHPRTILAATMLVIASTLLAGCPVNNPSAGGKQPTPVLVGLRVPGATLGSFVPAFPAPPMPPPFKVLPVTDGIVQVLFNAPTGSVFSVSARVAGATSNGTPLAESTHFQAGAGGFNVISVDASSVYTMEVQLPLILTAPPTAIPADILVVNRSLRTDMTDSDPMVVSLLPMLSTVTVVVNGAGHVISSPPGIKCGISPLGHVMAPCSFDFPPGTVTLEPNSRDNRVDHFDGWTSGCPGPPDSSCILTVDGIHNPPPLTARFSGP